MVKYGYLLDVEVMKSGVASASNIAYFVVICPGVDTTVTTPLFRALRDTLKRLFSEYGCKLSILDLGTNIAQGFLFSSLEVKYIGAYTEYKGDVPKRVFGVGSEESGVWLTAPEQPEADKVAKEVFDFIVQELGASPGDVVKLLGECFMPLPDSYRPLFDVAFIMHKESRSIRVGGQFAVEFMELLERRGVRDDYAKSVYVGSSYVLTKYRDRVYSLWSSKGVADSEVVGRYYRVFYTKGRNYMLYELV